MTAKLFETALEIAEPWSAAPGSYTDVEIPVE